MEIVIKLDEGYQDGSAYMVLGQIDLTLPGLFGGNKKRAVERLEKGLSFGKKNAFLRLRLAEAYLAVKRTEEAHKQLDEILSMGPDPDYQPEYEEAVAEARKMLSERFK
jgi:predicted Zn-dependent protease